MHILAVSSWIKFRVEGLEKSEAIALQQHGMMSGCTAAQTLRCMCSSVIMLYHHVRQSLRNEFNETTTRLYEGHMFYLIFGLTWDQSCMTSYIA